MRELNWAGNHAFTATTIHRPQTIDELRSIVSRPGNLHALGTRHSFNSIADATELVSLESMPHDLTIDTATMAASASAGIRYGVLASLLETAGMALHNMGSLPHISIGGATATATHGSGDRNRNLSAAVRSVELVTSEGDMVTFNRTDPDFSGVVVNLGALGVVTRLTFDIEPSYLVCQEVSEGLPWDALMESFDQIFGSAYSVSIFTSFADQAGVLWRKHRLANGEGPDTIERWGATPSTHHRHPVDALDGNACTPQLLDVGSWCERLPHFRLDRVPASGAEIQTEYMVARRDAVAVIEALRAFEPRMRDLLMISEIRTVAADDLWLSTAFERETVAFHFSWYLDPAGVNALLPELEAVLRPFTARPHWGKAFAMGHKEITDLYPEAEAFQRLRRRLDSRGTFMTPFLERLGLV
jgi:xylitol oxidase